MRPWNIVIVNSMIDLFLIPAGAALVYSGEIISRELIGGKTVLVNLAEK